MNNNTNRLALFLTEKLKLFLGISIGVFLFILFFQPFQPDWPDFENRLLFVAGFGVIIFLVLILVWLILPWIKNNQDGSIRSLLSFYLSGLIIFALSSVAFAFYLRYVGNVELSFYLVIKIILICLAPPVIVRLNEARMELQQQNEELLSERIENRVRIGKLEDSLLNKSIEFNSENGSETMTLTVATIAFIKSADNYVEIVYRQGDAFKRSLIRNTMKNIELQLKDYSVFIRCHRAWIVNRLHIEKLTRRNNNHWITIRGYQEQIPVSRQYLMTVKDLL